MNSRADLAEPESDAMSQRRLNYAGIHGNRLTQNANAAYDDYDMAQVRTQPRRHLGQDQGKGGSVPRSGVDEWLRR